MIFNQDNSDLVNAITSNSSAITGLEKAVAYVESSAIASRTYSVGEYVYITQYNRLYRVTIATPQGTSLDGHLTWLIEGGFNYINGQVTPQKLSATYLSNSYVSETEWNRVIPIRIGEICILFLNLALTNVMPSGTTNVAIGKITLPRNLEYEPQITLTPQVSETYGSLLLSVNVDGTVRISNLSGKTDGGWYRNCLVVALSGV